MMLLRTPAAERILRGCKRELRAGPAGSSTQKLPCLQEITKLLESANVDARTLREVIRAVESQAQAHAHRAHQLEAEASSSERSLELKEELRRAEQKLHAHEVLDIFGHCDNLALRRVVQLYEERHGLALLWGSRFQRWRGYLQSVDSLEGTRLMEHLRQYGGIDCNGDDFAQTASDIFEKGKESAYSPLLGRTHLYACPLEVDENCKAVLRVSMGMDPLHVEFVQLLANDVLPSLKFQASARGGSSSDEDA